ncbi:MAG: hypothetical protein ACQETH_08560 [Candidatus Rifleibacteriota bacterium]
MSDTEIESHKPEKKKSILLDQISILTIGFPFVIFKFLLGVVCLNMPSLPLHNFIGYILFVLGFVDALINLINFIFLFIFRRYFTEVCSLTIILAKVFKNSSHYEAWKEFGTSLDVMLSFTLVALMVGADLFGYLPPALTKVWSISVVINVLGAGLSRMLLTLPRKTGDN